MVCLGPRPTENLLYIDTVAYAFATEMSAYAGYAPDKWPNYVTHA